MADKKSWRDYLDSVKTGTSKNSEESGTWRDYLANRSSSSNTSASSNSSGGSGGWRDQIRPSVTNAIGNEISSRVNAWLEGHNSYVTDYQNRYADRKYSYEDAFVNDSGRWLDSVSEQMDKYEAERQEILSYMDQYSSYLDADWVKSVQDKLAKGREAQLQIRSVARNDFDWWNSFNNEELVQKYGSAEDAYKYYQRSDGYSKKYAGQTYDQLTETLKGLEDGEEKEWLGSYASQVDYDEKSKFDLEAGAKEIEDLEAQKEALIREFEAMDVVTGTPEGNKLNNEFLRNMEEYDKQISQKKAYLTLAKRVQEGIRLGSVADKESENYDPEFDQHSGYVSTQSGEWYSDLTSQFGMGYDDLTYEYINGKDNGMRSEIIGKAVARDYDTDDYFIYDHMTDSQIATYNYYYSKHGKEAADNYLDSIRDSLNYQEAADRFGKMKGKTALEFIFGIEAGVDQFQSGIKNLFSSADYIPTSSTQYLSGLVREDLKDNGPKLPGWMGGASLGQGTYDLITTTSNMAPSILTSTVVGAFNPAAGAAVGNALMGASAAGSAYQEALNLGYDKGQARTYSTLVGASEVGLQYLLGGIGKLGGSLSGKAAASLASKFDNAYIRLAVKYGTNMISEGTEEYLQEVLTPMFKNFALSTDEEVNLISEDAIYSFLLGALSSGFMEGTGISSDNGKGLIGNLIDMSSKNKANIKAATKYGDTEVQKALIKEGLASDVGSESHQLAEMFKRKTDKGKSMTGYEIRQQVEANEAQFVVENYEEALPLAKQRLTELGETKDVEKIAKLVAKRASGQELTPAEKSALVRSQYGAKVAKEMTPSNDPNQTYKPLESRVGTESSFGVSESGQATIQESGKAFDIQKAEVVAFTTDEATGKITDVTFKTEDGTEVQASGIDFADSDQSYLVEAVSKIENITPAAATAIIRDYDPSSGQSVGEYLNGIDEAYTYGYRGYSAEDMKAGNFATKLTDKQSMSAYRLGESAKKISSENKAQGIKRMRTAKQAAMEKAIADGEATPKTNGLTITYNKGGGNVVSVDEANAKDAQTGGIEVAKVLHKLGLGTRVELFSSYITKDEHGNKIRVFRDDNGVEQRAYSGVYRKSDGTIRIDLNAYNGKGLTLYALSHELTHFIQQWSTEKYEVLADFLVKTYEGTNMTMHDRVVKEQDRLKRIRRKVVSYSEAYDEVVANAMSKMFDDGKLVEKLTKLKEQDKTLAQKLWEGFKQIMSKFMGFYQNESLFQDADVLVDMKETFEKLQDLFAEALVEASDNFQASQQIGLEIDTATESVSPAVMHSEHTWTESDYVQERDKAAKEIAKAIGVTKKKAKDYIDSINSIAKMIAEDRSRLDYFSSHGRSSFVDNAEYGGSFDFSTLCKKRRLLTGTFTAIQKALPNTALTADEILDIRNRMKKANLEVSCGLCYVEGSRANMGQFAKEFLRLYKQYYPDAWQPNMADVNTPDGIEWVRINHPECYEQYEYFWNHYGTLKEGDKNLFASQQKPKLYQLHTEYKGEILNKFKNDDKVEDKNLNGGIRLQSFSDFEIVHLIDTMQIIMDMSRVGLAGQAYTKVPDFAWALGDTGLKINLSLIAKGVDADGKLIFDDVEGMPIAEAMKLRDRYSKNVGTILVAFNDEQLLAAMADDRVDFIIPFHRSRWKKSQYEAMGLPAKTKDYTFMQNEKYIKPQFHEYRGRMVKDKATNYMPNEYWDFSKSGKENAEAYLEMCARNNKRPKFYKLLQNNGDGSYSLKADGSTDGYWKLLIDFKMYDNDGNGSPQMPVKPEFNMEEANRMLTDYKGGHSNFPVAQGIVDSFVKDYKASHEGEQYSEHDVDTEADSAYDGVEKKTAQEDKTNGRREEVSHGGNAESSRGVGKENSRGEGSAREICERRIKEILREKVFKRGDKITSGRGRVETKETSADFESRVRNGGFMYVETGRNALAFKVATAQNENASMAADVLRKLGFDVIVFQGDLQHNGKGVTETSDTAITVRSAGCLTIFISSELDVGGMETSYHEAFHAAGYGMLAKYHEKISNIIASNVDVESEAFDRFVSVIAELYAYTKSEVSASKFASEIIEEFYAWYIGKAYASESGAMQVDMAQFSDVETIKSQVDDVYAQMEANADKALPGLLEGDMYSEHDTDYSNRSLLANAFETITNGSEEYKLIQKYKGYIAELNSQEEKLSEMNAQIRKIRFTKGEYDAEKLARLEGEAEKIRDAINKYDRYLLSLEASEPLRKVIERERKKEAQKTKKHVKEIQENKKLRAEQAVLRHKIRNFKQKLEAKLLRPTDRQYVPVDLIGAMVEVCNLIDTDTDLYKADGSINNAQVKRDETKEKLQNLKDEYEKLRNNSDPIYAGEFDEMVYTYLTELRDAFSGKSLKEMSLNELETMYEILISIDETLADARKLIGWGDAESVYEAGDAIVAEQNAIAMKRKNGKRNAAQRGWDTIDNLGLSPVRNVERMSGYNQDSALLKLFKRFEQGVRKKNKFKMDAYKLFEQLTSGKEYDDAVYKEVGGKKYTDIKGRKFGVSKMQMMQAILSLEREQANKSLHHIENGGFTFADLDKLNKGNLKDAVSAEHSHRVPAAVEMVAEFREILKDDKWCQDYMAAARAFFNGMAKDAINETSIALKHRIIAKDKNYIPFEVDKNFVNMEITDMDAVQQTINSYGMLKDTKNNAPQALYITGLNNILDRHIEQVGTVYGLAIEVRNFNKVWNVRSKDDSGNNPTVKESIDTSWGKEGVKHIEQAVKDIQGPRARERNPLYDKIKSGYIGSTFLLNLSVVTKQIGSLFSSTSMLRWRDPVKMIGNLIYTMANSKKISAEVDKYTATAWMRRQGMSDAELYTLMTEAKKPGLLKAFNKAPAVFNPTKWITAMDHAVALSLWKYAKQDTAKKTGLKGEELLKATAEFYDEVIENTQSMTDVLHRPEIQKRVDLFSESFAMFKTDLYQMAGQLQATAGRYMANKSKENGKALGRTVYAIAMGAVWGQLMTTVFALLRYKVDRYRDDDDEEEKLTAESWLKRQGFGLVGDLMGYIFPMFGSEVVGVFENIMYGEADDVVDSIALTAINDLYSAMITIGASIKDGEKPDSAKMRKFAAKALQVFGIPANNILRTLDAIQLHAEDIANGEFFSFNAGVDSKTDDLYDAIVSGNKSVHSKLKASYVDKEGNFDKDKYDTAVRKALRENDPRIHEAAMARYEGKTEEYKRIFREIRDEGVFTWNEIMDAVNSEENAIKNKLEPDKATSTYSASDFVQAVAMNDIGTATAARDDILDTAQKNGKTQEEAEKEFMASVKSNAKEAYLAGLLDDARAKEMLMEYTDMDEEEVASRVDYWAFCKDNPKYADSLNESNVNKYKEFAEPAEIPLDVYVQYVEGTKGLETIKDEWGDEVMSVRDQVLEVIDSLPLTWQQKDALYLAHGYSENTIWDVPW